MMKVLVACVLAITIMMYTAEVTVENAQKFTEDYRTCADELNSTGFTIHVVECMFKKNSLIDEQGAMKKDEILKYYGSITSNQQELQKIASCIDAAENRIEGSNHKKTLLAIQCLIFRLSMLSKFE